MVLILELHMERAQIPFLLKFFDSLNSSGRVSLP